MRLSPFPCVAGHDTIAPDCRPGTSSDRCWCYPGTGEGSLMEFEEVLEQTIALLQRQGRISYGALKRRFKMDDTYLEDLKIELIEAQQLAHDENCRVLVWSGGEDQTPLAEPTHVARRIPEAERRQLTVMFCDLVDSTALAVQLDP